MTKRTVKKREKSRNVKNTIRIGEKIRRVALHLKKPFVRGKEIKDPRITILGAKLLWIHSNLDKLKLNEEEKIRVLKASEKWQRILLDILVGIDREEYISSLEQLVNRILKNNNVIYPKSEKEFLHNLDFTERMIKDLARESLADILTKYKFPDKLKRKVLERFNEDMILLKHKTAGYSTASHGAYFLDGKIIIDPTNPDLVDIINEELIHFIHNTVNPYTKLGIDIGMEKATEFLAALHRGEGYSNIREYIKRYKMQYKTMKRKKDVDPYIKRHIKKDIKDMKKHITYDDAAILVESGARDRLVEKYGYHLFTMHPIRLVLIGKKYAKKLERNNKRAKKHKAKEE